MTNDEVVSVKRTADGKAVSFFTTWDRRSYKDEFFCNGDHAKKFAYAAARGGHAMRAWNDAMKLRLKPT